MLVKRLVPLIFMLFILTPAVAMAQPSPVVKNSLGTAFFRLHLGIGFGSNAATPAALQKFIEECITPRFGNGFIVHDTSSYLKGKFFNASKQRALIIDIPASSKSQPNINAIIKDYLERFKSAHPSVLLIEFNAATTKYDLPLTAE